MSKRDISFENFINMAMLKTKAVIIGSQAILAKNVHLMDYLCFIDKALKEQPELFSESVLNHINKVMAVWLDNPSSEDINSSAKWLLKKGFRDEPEKEKNNDN